MKVNLHIDRLILDGIDVPATSHGVLQASVENELTRVLLENGGALSGLTAGTVPHRVGPTLRATTDLPRLGRRIARSVYEGLSE